ncbi:hypothetical protein TWF481_008792 [Arthrobotrys musiformis]|uniref:F-box domain-containing protein n=1 Tax=Arthrobotrys musiformis TaxID=47236 RepID=A0AAV9W888_9PEZI
MKEIGPSSPFLNLPRELRDEIYKCLLLSTPPPVPLDLQGPFPLGLQDPFPYRPISRDLSILRVNKQIHAEASRLFYSQTNFWIKITVSDWHTPQYIGQITQFEVLYEDPWAELNYSYDEKGQGHYSGFETFEPAPQAYEFVRDKEVESTPASTYRDLIRHVRVDILDTRVTRETRESYTISAAGRNRVRKLLLPFAYRLGRILSGAGKDAEVQINIISNTFKEEGCKNATGESDAESLDLYRELVETIWPFTTGPWVYKLNLPPRIEQKHPGLGKEVIEWCDENNEVTEEERFGFEVMKTRYPYFFVRKGGRCIVMEEDLGPLIS